MTGPFSWSFTTGPAPAVTSETPISGATGVATSTALTATFNEAVQALTVTSSSLVLKSSSGATVPATVSYNSSTNTATLTPSALLANSTTYTATVSGVEDTAGDPMAAPYSWLFTTGPAPAVTSYTPASGATGVSVSSPVTATFNEAVQSSTISFTLTSSSGTAVAASVAYNSSNYTITLTPSAALGYSTSYTATVSAAKDTAGDSMSGPFTWSFTTVAQPAPTITTCSPASGATGVAVSSAVTATFNEAVQSSTIGWSIKTPSGSSMAATTAYNSATNTVTMSPTTALANSTTYTVTISGAQNSSGVAMTSPVTWSFITAAASVAGAPTVISESPGSGATAVPVSSSELAILPLTATFNQPVQPGTINVTLTTGGSSVAATSWYSDDTDTVSLSPEATLANSTTYTATISGAESSSGVAMSAPFSWSFTTTAASVTTPTVMNTSPAFNGTSVDIDTPVTVNFNETVLGSSISSANFTLVNASVELPSRPRSPTPTSAACIPQP